MTSYLHKNELAHNVFFTRGQRLSERSNSDTKDTIRIFIWVRKPSTGTIPIATAWTDSDLRILRNRSKYFSGNKAVTRTLLGGGGGIYIFMFCPTCFFSNQIQTHQFEKKFV